MRPNCDDCPYKEYGFVKPELHPNSHYLFVGQNPGQEELKAGYPFCEAGQSGALLRSYLRELTDKGFIYSITNAFKCGTPNNKTPTPKEVELCNPYLLEDIAYTNPKLIVALGKPAMIALTGIKSSILELNGHILRQFNPPVLICVHPSYVLRQGRDLKVFEKGILPALKYFDEAKEVEVKVVETIPPTDEVVGFDIETSSLHPHTGIIKCFSVSNGDKVIFVEIEE